MIFSETTELLILLLVPAAFWHMMVIQVAARASPRKIAVVGIGMLAWTAFGVGIVRYGLDDPVLSGVPYRPIIYLLLLAGVGWLLRDYLLGRGVSQQVLISLQLIRPIGMVFVYEASRGTLPDSFAQPAGWGDLLAGVVALVVLVRYPRGKVPAPAVLLVAVVGLLDFVSAFFFGTTSGDNPTQLFAFDNPNQVLAYPTGLIPLFLVPYAVIAHLLSLAQLVRDRGAERAGQHPVAAGAAAR